MRVDAHHHLWDLATRPQPWTKPFPALARSYSVDDLRPELTPCYLDATVVVQTVTVAEETPELLALAEREALIAGVVGWVDLWAPDVENRLAALRTGAGGNKLVGIRHQVQDETGDTWFFEDATVRGLRAVAAQGLTYDLILRPDQLAGARLLAQSLPELTFVLDHGGNPNIGLAEREPWQQDISALAALPNLAVKLSGLVTRASESWSVELLQPYAEHLLDAFGATRVLFGSDWPVCLLRCSYRDVVLTAERLTEHLAPAERDGVFGGNAVRWYQLGKDD